jgi:hypothetical protein
MPSTRGAAVPRFMLCQVREQDLRLFFEIARLPGRDPGRYVRCACWCLPS